MAYSGLAYAYFSADEFYLSPQDAAPGMREFVRKALQLDDRLAEAHVWLAFVNFSYDWDWAAAEREFDRALELDPNSAVAHEAYGVYLSMMRRFDQAIAEGKCSVELDALSLEAHNFLGQSLIFARRHDEAIDLIGKALDLDPNYFFARLSLGQAYLAKGDTLQAIAQLEQARKVQEVSDVVGALGYAYAAAGRKAEAKHLLTPLSKANVRACPQYRDYLCRPWSA